MNWSGPDVGWIPVNAGAGPGLGGLEVTGDAGRHWTRLGLAADWSITDAALVSPTNGFVAGVSRQPSGDIPFLAETTDGGATWQQILPALTPTRTLQMLTPGTGFGLGLAMDPGQLTVTHNGGRSWSPVGPASLRGLDPALIAFTSRTSGDVLALPPNDYLSAPARLFHTTDGGATWSAGRPVPLYQLTAFCMAGRDGIALGMDRALEGRVLRTSNGGRTFLAGAGAPPTWAAAACAPDARNLYVTTVRPTPPGAKKAGWNGARLVLKRVQVATGRSQVLHVWPDPHGALRYEPAPVDMLPGGTGYITDVGMTGPWRSVLGVDAQTVVDRFLTQMPSRFTVAGGPAMFNGLVLDADDATGRARAVTPLFRREPADTDVPAEEEEKRR
jgi:photosystem II stability/assembly factor-like uncharacterized protein